MYFEARKGTEEHTYRGVLLVDLLAQAKPAIDPDVKNGRLRFYAAVTGSDGYTAVIAYGEIDPDFGGRPVLLAVAEDGRPLDTEGPRLVVPGDKKGGRYVTNVVRVTVGEAAVDA